MSQVFDSYRSSYENVVQDSIAFSGLKHDFFLEAKIIQLKTLFERHFGAGKPALLDIGCGVGRMHPLLAPLCASLSGTDLSTESLERARLDNPDVAYRTQVAGSLDWPEAGFDATLAVCVLHHVPVADRAGFLAEMARVTRPGGLAIIIEHNPFNPLTRLAVARCPFDHDAVLLRHGEAADRLAAAGLHRIESRHFLIAPTLASPVRRIERLFEYLPLGAQYISHGVVQ
ncbi:MAG: class I SAM-dependent methyltransferase [Hyphomicrobiales bacterium]|jgi:SAM-dependent methyltransferase|nr:class I SAM-dependent methyltransferase [Hyphomicrobiales bacterium]